MYCCENCFKDTYIKKMILQEKNKSDCDFCSSKNVYVIDISKPNYISEAISRLIQVYTISNSSKAKPLKESLREDWDIFNNNCETIQRLVMELCSEYIEKTDSIYHEKVIISSIFDNDFQEEYSVVKGMSWNEFSEHLKYKNRFHNKYFNADAFSSFLTYFEQKELDKDVSFYRARICNNKNGYKKEEMYCPPKEKRCAGRINPEGIGVLYLSSDNNTTLYEIRANIYDYVSIGEFKAIKSLKLVDLSKISKCSPFLLEDMGLEFERFAINRNIFRDMCREIAKPMRRNDSIFEYLPTQFIAEFIKNQGYDGVSYESTLNKDGYNYALFDEGLVECICVKTIEINDISYTTNE